MGSYWMMLMMCSSNIGRIKRTSASPSLTPPPDPASLRLQPLLLPDGMPSLISADTTNVHEDRTTSPGAGSSRMIIEASEDMVVDEVDFEKEDDAVEVEEDQQDVELEKREDVTAVAVIVGEDEELGITDEMDALPQELVLNIVEQEPEEAVLIDQEGAIDPPEIGKCVRSWRC
jgi:hypothetical protein